MQWLLKNCMLSNNIDPSYILSIFCFKFNMVSYDPSATLRSMNCFRDRLQHIQHNVAYVTQNGEPLPFYANDAFRSAEKHCEISLFTCLQPDLLTRISLNVEVLREFIEYTRN